MLDLKALSREVQLRLKRDRFLRVSHRISDPPGKCGFELEATGFLVVVSVWNNGCCDFGFLDVASKKDLAWHYELCCLEDAVRCIIHDIDHLPLSARQAAGPIRPA